jgi:hypothetical protein
MQSIGSVWCTKFQHTSTWVLSIPYGCVLDVRTALVLDGWGVSRILCGFYLHGSSLILFSHLCLCLQRVFFPSEFSTKLLYTFLIPPMHVTFPTHLVLIIFGGQYKLWSSTLYTSSRLQPLPFLRSIYSLQHS